MMKFFQTAPRPERLSYRYNALRTRRGTCQAPKTQINAIACGDLLGEPSSTFDLVKKVIGSKVAVYLYKPKGAGGGTQTALYAFFGIKTQPRILNLIWIIIIRYPQPLNKINCRHRYSPCLSVLDGSFKPFSNQSTSITSLTTSPLAFEAGQPNVILSLNR